MAIDDPLLSKKVTGTQPEQVMSCRLASLSDAALHSTAACDATVFQKQRQRHREDAIEAPAPFQLLPLQWARARASASAVASHSMHPLLPQIHLQIASPTEVWVLWSSGDPFIGPIDTATPGQAAADAAPTPVVSYSTSAAGPFAAKSG